MQVVLGAEPLAVVLTKYCMGNASIDECMQFFLSF